MTEPVEAGDANNSSGTRKSRHWTNTYEQWDGWEDPDELAKKREEEERRLKNFRENKMTCNHDRSAERTVMEMSIEDKLKACQGFRLKGNLFHQEGQYRRAALQYRQALNYYEFCFPDKDSEQKELDEMRQACLLNSAACFLACRELDEALDCCYQALREEPDNVKALYRRAVVYRLRDRFKEASADLGKALLQRPNDVTLRKESAVLKSKIESYRERRKEMGKQIFGREDPGQAINKVEGVSPSHEGNGLPLGDQNDAEGGIPVWDPPENLAEALGKDRTVPGWMGRLEGEGCGKEEGRRRHDLSLPVVADFSELEEIVGCAWPAGA